MMKNKELGTIAQMLAEQLGACQVVITAIDKDMKTVAVGSWQEPVFEPGVPRTKERRLKYMNAKKKLP